MIVITDLIGLSIKE